METEIINNPAIVKAQNVSAIVEIAPQVYEQNRLSHDRCLAAGNELLDRILAQGMDAMLDKEVADYIERTKSTLKKLNAKRAPLTKLFDEIRSVFTTMEGDIDPSKATTVPGRLQGARNAYAAEVRREAERRRQLEEKLRMSEAARKQYSMALEDFYKTQFNALVAARISDIGALLSGLTVNNYEETRAGIADVSSAFDAAAWLATIKEGVPAPPVLDTETVDGVRAQVRAALSSRLAEQYAFEIETNRADALDRLPSRYAMVKRAAESDAAEARRLKELMEAREAEEARAREEQRLAREQAEKAAREAEANAARMNGLFGAAQALEPVQMPATTVRKRIVCADASAFMAIVGFWWSREGQYLTVDELNKIFRRMVTFCEKAANDRTDPVFIEDPAIAYQDEVKAK